jgi:hypothetical protein
VATAYKPIGSLSAIKYVLGSESNLNEFETNWTQEGDIIWVNTTTGADVLLPNDYLVKFQDNTTAVMTADVFDSTYEIA